mmetsp:Transcript_36952/g.59531  ORF Transcript_36952/g.59531 Transcript_36952/m.59531 type:complete len:339 (-) Transcript_36952:58-1074(-)
MQSDPARSNDLELPKCCDDSVSSLKFSPNSNFLSVTSWDNSCSVFEYSKNGNTIQANPKAQMSNPHSGPVLGCSWNSGGNKIYTVSADKTGKVWDLASSQVVQFAAHDAPIEHVFAVEEMGMVITASWDKTIKYWPINSLGQGQPAATVTLSERVYAMDVKYPAMVVACADKQIYVFDLNKPTEPMRTHASPLRHQIRTISLFVDKKGYAMGSIEGRVQIYHVDQAEQSKNFAFKCHRDTNTQEIYAVNAICFHKQFGTFCTAGSDGTFNFWDKDAKQRLKNFAKLPNSISAVDFNHTGDIFGYAIGYDWSKGYDAQNRANESVWLHPVQEAEVKPKK